MDIRLVEAVTSQVPTSFMPYLIPLVLEVHVDYNENKLRGGLPASKVSFCVEPYSTALNSSFTATAKIHGTYSSCDWLSCSAACSGSS